MEKEEEEEEEEYWEDRWGVGRDEKQTYRRRLKMGFDSSPHVDSSSSSSSSSSCSRVDRISREKGRGKNNTHAK